MQKLIKDDFNVAETSTNICQTYLVIDKIIYVAKRTPLLQCGKSFKQNAFIKNPYLEMIKLLNIFYNIYQTYLL